MRTRPPRRGVRLPLRCPQILAFHYPSLMSFKLFCESKIAERIASDKQPSRILTGCDLTTGGAGRKRQRLSDSDVQNCRRRSVTRRDFEETGAAQIREQFPFIA